MLRSELWKSSHSSEIDQTVIRLQFDLLLFWPHPNPRISPIHLSVSSEPKVTERVVFTVEEVEEALADSYSCFMFPQMKEGRLDVSERERGSCVSSTKPD